MLMREIQSPNLASAPCLFVDIDKGGADSHIPTRMVRAPAKR
jgi:hypothetical protein